ncbi:MAG: DNA alkylation repair protein [Lachnospiraceae bacterium]|nr:DNA alkylation repair protein [Lachnospiraceae bacterium]
MSKPKAITDIQKGLFSIQDVGYKNFQAKLMPTVNPDKIIGVRAPELKKYAKEYCNSYKGDFYKEKNISKFLDNLPHVFYEEDNFHGLIISNIKDFDTVISLLDDFLPYVDNWATCDSLKPKIFKKYPKELLPHIKRWIKSKHTYEVRFAISMLMTFYLDENFDIKFAKEVLKVDSEEYYINMMIAWYFATALAKKYDAIIPIIESKTMKKWIQNKTIQKAIESYRISDEQKTYLKTLKIK